jgi:FdhE protein
MKAAQTGGPDYDARMRRASSLASKYPFAAEVLAFYEKLAAFQKDFYRKILSSSGTHAVARTEGQLRSELPLGDLLQAFPDLLSLLGSAGPPPVADAARSLGSRNQNEWRDLLAEFWTFGGRADVSETEVQDSPNESLEEFVLRAFSQPYAEFLASRMAEPPLAGTYRACPRCGSAPLLGVLRPEGDGGKRRLLCSFCLQEWDFRRIFCAACGEEDENKLPVYVAEQFPHVRVESCDTCKFYLRTIDLTKDGNAVPIVDDLAAIPLSLWAHEHGYTRLQPNLLGT